MAVVGEEIFIANLHCSYWKRDGHIQDQCYSPNEFSDKTTYVTQSSGSGRDTLFSASEYKKFFQFKPAQQASSSSATVAQLVILTYVYLIESIGHGIKFRCI